MRRRILWFAIVPGITAGCAGMVGLLAALLVLALLVIKLLWAWTIPDLFPGAIESGHVAESLSWYVAFKLAVFVVILGGLAGFRRGRNP